MANVTDKISLHPRLQMPMSSTTKIADANVTAAKLTAGAGTAGRVALADAAGAVTFGNIPSTSVTGYDLTSTDITVTGGTGATLNCSQSCHCRQCYHQFEDGRQCNWSSRASV